MPSPGTPSTLIATPERVGHGDGCDDNVTGRTQSPAHGCSSSPLLQADGSRRGLSDRLRPGRLDSPRLTPVVSSASPSPRLRVASDASEDFVMLDLRPDISVAGTSCNGVDTVLPSPASLLATPVRGGRLADLNDTYDYQGHGAGPESLRA
eukprot:689219-Pyramimonas_sp.AAC.1